MASVDRLYRVDATCDVANLTTTDDDTSQQYLEDPDLLADSLPQPYRRINRTLNQIIDDVLQIAEAKELKLIRDRSRRQAPQYDSANVVEVMNFCSCSFDCVGDGSGSMSVLFVLTNSTPY